MKSVELFCASPASTAICSSMDKRSMVRQGGMRPIDHRHGHHSHRHKTRTPIIPCSSEIPISPIRPNYFEKTRKSFSSSAKQNLEYLRRKSSADITDLSSPPPRTGSSSRHLLSDTPFLDILSDSENFSSSALVPSQPLRSTKLHQKFKESPVFRPSFSSTHSYDNPAYEFSLSGRSNDDLHAYNDDFKAQKSSLTRRHDDFHGKKSSLSRLIHEDFHAKKSSLSQTNTFHSSKSSLTCTNEGHAHKSPSSTPGRPRRQVVELRVSIHCKGCEGKIRKHIAKMEGVTSFSTDLATKKVTVIGNVTPLGVLTSISKVKNAEFWSSSPTSSSSSSSTVGMMSLVSV
ncbi:hypothetical protein ACH5RR_020853 [Cinchona calisaya]|uniref:HMA domain-containing protein n=1 Tax=Cinchona calisaya TaxID=153742 RepID=A0ABD2ZFM9_9GENT